MKNKFILFLICLTNNFFIFGSDADLKTTDQPGQVYPQSFNPSHTQKIYITGTIQVANEILPFNELPLLEQQKLQNIPCKQNHYVINVSYKDLKAQNTVDISLQNQAICEFNFEEIDIFKIGYLPIDLIFDFIANCQTGEKVTQKNHLFFNRILIIDYVTYICDIVLTPQLLIPKENILEPLKNKLRYLTEDCCCTIPTYSQNNFCDLLCCCVTLGCCPTCPFKNCMCPTESGRCVIQ